MPFPVAHHDKLGRRRLRRFEPLAVEHAAHRARLPVAFEDAGAGLGVEVKQRLDILFAIDIGIFVEPGGYEQALAARSPEPLNEAPFDPFMADVAGI